MKKMWKRVSSMVLIAALTISLAACANQEKKNDADANAPENSDPGATTATAVPDENEQEKDKDLSYSGFNPLDYGMEPFENKVKIKIPVFDRADPNVPVVNDNYYTRWINENFGVNMNVEVEFIPITRSDTMGSYNLLLASGDWPTVFMEYDWDKVCQWSFDGALKTFDLEAFKSTAPVWFEKAGGQEMFDLFKLKDGYTFAPALRPEWNTFGTFVVFYRKDWYKKAGLELPKTYDEYFNAMKTFIELGYTNGIPPLPKGPFSENYQPGAFAEWPRDEEAWVMHSGVTVAPLSYEPMREALRRENREYNAGFFSNEFEIDAGNNSADTANFVNGNTYQYGMWLSSDMPDLRAFYEKNPDAELGIIGNTTVYFDRYQAGLTEVPHGRAANPAGMFVGFSDKATDDELKAAWLYMEWMAQPDVLFFMQNGVEGETYTLNDKGLPIMNVEYNGEKKIGFGSNKDYWCIAVEVKQIGTMEDTIAGLVPQDIPQDFTQELIDLYHISVQKNVVDGLIYPDPYFSVPIETVNLYAGDLRSLFIEAATKLVKCKPEEFDALYDKYAQQYLDAGYREIMEERLQAFQDGNASKLFDIAAGRKPFVPSDISKIAVYK
ncbi:putative aldouronate transport system substrate-binding protein [Anaerotaenia torta]|uniref:hypothetical protein n=1 Tax=Anaerotaenia torta TaxID=433293 RepID=UPI003D1E7FBD